MHLYGLLNYYYLRSTVILHWNRWKNMQKFTWAVSYYES